MSKWIFNYRCAICGEPYWLKVVNGHPMPIVVDASDREKNGHFCEGEFINCKEIDESEASDET